MKASELRDVLAGLMQKFGDLEVHVFDNDGSPSVALAAELVAYAKPQHFLITPEMQ